MTKTCQKNDYMYTSSAAKSTAQGTPKPRPRKNRTDWGGSKKSRKRKQNTHGRHQLGTDYENAPWGENMETSGKYANWTQVDSVALKIRDAIRSPWLHYPIWCGSSWNCRTWFEETTAPPQRIWEWLQSWLSNVLRTFKKCTVHFRHIGCPLRNSRNFSNCFPWFPNLPHMKNDSFEASPRRRGKIACRNANGKLKYVRYRY